MWAVACVGSCRGPLLYISTSHRAAVGSVAVYLAEVDDEDIAAHAHAVGVVGDVAASLGRGVVIGLAGVQDQRAAMVEDAARAGRGVVRGRSLSLNPLTW